MKSQISNNGGQFKIFSEAICPYGRADYLFIILQLVSPLCRLLFSSKWSGINGFG